MDPLWEELQHTAQRRRPRYGPEWGTCPLCGLGATVIVNWGIVTYGICFVPCRQRWVIGTNLFNGVFGAKKSESREAFLMLAELEQLETGRAVVSTPHTTTEELMKKQQNDQPLNTPNADAVERTVAAVEALSLDEPDLTDAVERAREVVESVGLASMGVVFPASWEPAPDGAFADFKFAVECSNITPYESVVPILTKLHQDALEGKNSALAALTRGGRGQTLILKHARNSAAGDPDRTEVAEERAIGQFVRDVARQLMTRELFAPHAQILCELVPDWTARLNTVAQRRKDHEAAKLRAAKEAEARERQQREAIERQQQQLRWAATLKGENLEQRRRREELADFFRRHQRYQFTVEGRTLTGEQAAEEILEGADFMVFFRSQGSGTTVMRTR